MFCGISGESPEQPVVSTKSGQIYEKRLITKYIAENGKDPITGEELTVEELLEIKGSPKAVKPRPPTLTSIPSLLSVFQNEWDSVMLETFMLKQQYQQARQELSHALYQYDAATRVIARLIKERDAAREALANIQAHLGNPAAADAPEQAEAMDMEMEVGSTLPSTVIEKIVDTSEALSKTRKKRKPSPDLTPVEKIQTYTQTSMAPSLHTTRSPGISCIDLDVAKGLVLTGGLDHHVLIYDINTQKVTGTLKGHTKKVTSVHWRGKPDIDGKDMILTSGDMTVKIWSHDEKLYKTTHTFTDHTEEVMDLSIHPSKDYVVSVAGDSSWAFHDIETSKTFIKVKDNEHTQGYTVVQFHPDGMIMAAGLANDGLVRIWDIRQQQSVATFPKHTGSISALTFSENGYVLATASQDKIVKLWDLRKLVNFKSFDLEEDSKIHALDFDYSGAYLAVGGTDVRIFKTKEGNELCKLQENANTVTGIKWGPEAKYLVAGGLDRALRIFAPAE